MAICPAYKKLLHLLEFRLLFTHPRTVKRI
jgi:hypothetical protein